MTSPFALPDAEAAAHAARIHDQHRLDSAQRARDLKLCDLPGGAAEADRAAAHEVLGILYGVTADLLAGIEARDRIDVRGRVDAAVLALLTVVTRDR